MPRDGAGTSQQRAMPIRSLHTLKRKQGFLLPSAAGGRWREVKERTTAWTRPKQKWQSNFLSPVSGFPLPAAMTMQQSPSSHPFHPGTAHSLKWMMDGFFVQLSVLHCSWIFMTPVRQAYYDAGNPRSYGIRLASHQAQHNVHTLSIERVIPFWSFKLF